MIIKKISAKVSRPSASVLHSASHYHQRSGVHPIPTEFTGDEQCIELITAGRGWIEIGGQWQEATPGGLFWHVAGDVTIGRSDFRDPYRCLAVRFRTNESRGPHMPQYTRWEELDEVRLFTAQVVQLHADGAFDPGVLLRYILSRVHFQAELFLRTQKERDLPPKLRKVLEMINRQYAEPLRLADLAGSAGWSVAHLHDRFKERLGYSPHQAIIRRRMQVARELLASTNDPVKSVAARCGFPTASAFCVQFKRSTQLSPKAYRLRQLFGARG